MAGVNFRSISEPAPVVRETPDDEDRTIDFPSLPVDDLHSVVTPWMRELSTARSGRQSRASSIISTRTRFSTTTLDEVRSIEISAGGRTFKISRDGSQVTDTTAPPPYPGALTNDNTDSPPVLDDPPHLDEDDDLLSEQPLLEPGQREGRKRVRIVMPNSDDVDNAEDEADHAQPEPDSPTATDRVLSRAEFYKLVVALPSQLKRVLGLQETPSMQNLRLSSFRGLSAEHLSSSNASTGSWREESLPVAESGVGFFGKTSEPNNRAARPASSWSLPESLSFGGRRSMDVDADATSPEVNKQKAPSHVQYDTAENLADSSMETLRSLPLLPGVDAVSIPATIHDLNDLSLVYNRVMRDLDRQHRKKLHERDRDLEHLRSLLNEKDVIYRQQLKGKDFVIEDLRQKLAHLEDTIEDRLEKARHQVEDMWEKRWKERDKHLMERMRRMEEATLPPTAANGAADAMSRS